MLRCRGALRVWYYAGNRIVRIKDFTFFTSRVLRHPAHHPSPSLCVISNDTRRIDYLAHVLPFDDYSSIRLSWRTKLETRDQNEFFAKP